MITNEPSTQQTPLPTEPAGLPEQPLNQEMRPASIAAPSSASQPWIKLLLAILLWFASVLLLIFVPAIVAVPYLLYRALTTGLPHAQALANDRTLLFISIAGVVPTHLLTLGLVWLLVTEKGKYPFWKTIGFEWPKEWGPLIGSLICIPIAIVLLLIGWGVTTVWGGGKTQLDLLVESSIPARFATAFIAVFTAPLVEELVYRGIVYSAIERALGTIVAVGAVSLLFAGVHVFQYVNNVSVITVITMLSITLTLMRAYTGKVLPSFIIHLVFNGIQSLFIALAPFAGLGGGSS